MKEQTSRARLCVHSQHADGGGDGVPDGHAHDVGVLQEPADLDLDATCLVDKILVQRCTGQRVSSR